MKENVKANILFPYSVSLIVELSVFVLVSVFNQSVNETSRSRCELLESCSPENSSENVSSSEQKHTCFYFTADRLTRFSSSYWCDFVYNVK
jgi:hypothetical protein